MFDQEILKNQNQSNYFFVHFEEISSTSSNNQNQFASNHLDKNNYNFEWESDKFPEFPVSIILKLRQRVEMDFCLIQSKLNFYSENIKFYLADSLEQFNLNTSFKKIGEAFNIKNEQQQVQLKGVGNILKLVIYGYPERINQNSFQKVGFKIFKIWARLAPIGISKFTNKYLENEYDQISIQKILLEQGFDMSFLQSQERYNSKNFSQPIDLETKQTVQCLLKEKQKFIEQNDFKSVQILMKDLDKVIAIGSQIHKLQLDLEYSVNKQDFESAENFKKQIEDLKVKRDYYDMFYETERYENFIIMDNESFIVDQQINEPQQIPIQEEIIKTQCVDNFKENKEPIEENKPTIKLKNQTPQKKISFKQYKQKQQPQKVIKANPDFIEEKWTKGDRNLEKYFKFDNKLQEQIFLKEFETLRNKNEKIQKIFGKKVWGSLHNNAWVLRKKAAEAVYLYIKSDSQGNPSENIQKYKSKTELFRGLCEILQVILNDKIHQVFQIGSAILEECFSKNICDDTVSEQTINYYLSIIISILIEKSQIINEKISDFTIKCLIDIFEKNNCQLEILVDEIQKAIRYKNKNGEIVLKDINKIAKYKIVALLKIFVSAFKIQPQNQVFLGLFKDLLIPCFYHNQDLIRESAIEEFKNIYPYHPKVLLNYIEECTEINQFTSRKIDKIVEKLNKEYFMNDHSQEIIQEIPDEENQSKSQQELQNNSKELEDKQQINNQFNNEQKIKLQSLAQMSLMWL